VPSLCAHFKSMSDRAQQHICTKILVRRYWGKGRGWNLSHCGRVLQGKIPSVDIPLSLFVPKLQSQSRNFCVGLLVPCLSVVVNSIYLCPIVMSNNAEFTRRIKKMWLSLWLCKIDKGIQVWHIIYLTSSPWVHHSSYSAAPASLHQACRILNDGLQTSRLQQTVDETFVPLKYTYFFQVWKNIVVWSSQIRWMNNVFQHFKVQIRQISLCDDSRVWGGVVLEKWHYCDSFPRRLKTIFSFTLPKRCL
jgi:hypothetical protein